MAQSKGQHVFFLNSTDSLNIWSDNRPFSFTCELPEKVRLKGRWICALYSVSFQERVSVPLVVTSDVCESSVIQNERHAVLQVIPQNSGRHISFNNLLWFDVSLDEIERIKLFIRTSNLDEASFLTKPVTCALVLRRVS